MVGIWDLALAHNLIVAVRCAGHLVAAKNESCS